MNSHFSLNPAKRIELVDALRGFALSGILLLHSLEHFDFLWNAELNPAFFKSIDPYTDNIVRFLFSGKAYSIFSIMFGFSFFIQMDRNRNRGIDFSLRFLWRLTILLALGYLHSLVYIGDILTIYALMGIPLVLFYRLNKKTLIWLSVLLVLQIPTIYNLVISYLYPGFEYHRTFGRGLYSTAFRIFAEGSFADVVKFNMWKGHIAVISWTYYNGRYLQLLGLFIAGLTIGKSRFFENVDKNKKLILKVFIISILTFAVLYTLFLILPKIEMPDSRLRLFRTLVKSYADLAFTTLLITSFIIIYQYLKDKISFTLLASYGRMSLTSYVLQPLIGVPLFYGFGFALYRYFGVTLSVIYGLLFLLIQLAFCRIWFRYFRYGPLEWLWRAITFLDFKIKIRKQSDR